MTSSHQQLAGNVMNLSIETNSPVRALNISHVFVLSFAKKITVHVFALLNVNKLKGAQL